MHILLLVSLCRWPCSLFIPLYFLSLIFLSLFALCMLHFPLSTHLLPTGASSNQQWCLQENQHRDMAQEPPGFVLFDLSMAE